MVLAELRRRWGVAEGQGRGMFGGMLYDVRGMAGGAEQRVMMLEPHTFMNRSGESVNGLVTFYKAELCDVLIVLDDMALPLGAMRARPDGSAGGHNGLKDVLRLLGSQDVPRLRLGVGSPPPLMDAADYVLAAFGDDEQPAVKEMIVRAADAVEDWIGRDIRYVMDKYNRKADA